MTEDIEQSSAYTSYPKPRSAWQTIKTGALFFFGIILPLITLVTEAVTGICADTFFDPIPTVAQGALVALVPCANLLTWLALRRGWRTHLGLLGMVNGVALAVAFWYALVFLPVLPIAGLAVILAIVLYGIGLLGLLPMSPAFAFICAWRYRTLMRQQLCAGGRMPRLWQGILLGVVLIIASFAQSIATKVAVGMAASPKPEQSQAGIAVLRKFGDKDIMARACYRGLGEPMDLIGFFSSIYKDVDLETARMIYFRVTGEAYNAKPVRGMGPGMMGRRGRSDEFEFDLEQGGDAVAGQLKGLSLGDSRLDGTVNADAALAYVEWTMVFKNTSFRQREARAQILLPPGAVVSRLTLWINGEEREAAFGGRSQVRTAYEQVVRRQRDPVLVTTCGPDRILVQCFPVPPDGGEMKMRIGITIPLLIDDPRQGVLLLPRILERNFGIPATRKHAVWLEGGTALSSSLPALLNEQAGEHKYAVRGDLTTDEMNAPQSFVSVVRTTANDGAWAKDSKGDGAMVVVQKLVRATVPMPDRIVVVIDGAQRMEPYLADIAAALECGMQTNTCTILFARDGVRPVADVGSGGMHDAAEAVRALRCAGGQDNTEALTKAWDVAAQGGRGVILWIHSPQSYLLAAGEQLRQRLERRKNGPLLYELQTENGADRLVQKMDGLVPVRHGIRRGALSNDLARILLDWQASRDVWSVCRTRTDASNTVNGVEERAAHLVRLWAADRIADAFASGDKVRIEEATKLGIRYNVVTPLTGAVVLENKQQYQETDLEPVPPGSVPTVPEAEIWVLVVVALVAVAVAATMRRSCRAS